MAIVLEHINFKKDDVVIFNDLNLEIKYNKIIGLYGDKSSDFINFLKDKDFNTGKIIDDDYYLNNVIYINEYNDFVTNNVKDELYIKFNYNETTENEIIKVLKKFDLDNNFLERSINTLSSFEKKLLNLIILMFDKSKIIILNNLFDGIDYKNKSLFIRLLKNIKKNYNKTIIIFDRDMDTINNLVDYMLIIDTNLVLINKIDDIFDNEDINKVDVNCPNLIKIKKLLKNKGINIDDINNINDLLRK